MTWLARLIDLIRRRQPVDPVPPGGEWSIPLASEINAERQLRGLSPLLPHGPACTLAADWAAVCAKAGKLDHGNSGARIAAVYPGRPSGENLAMGQTSPEQVVRDWMTSPGHARNVVGDWTIVGAGRARGRDQQSYWCAVFVR
jgi:uncharacterized protein YkwD